MMILALDTSTRHCSTALLRDEQVLARTGGVTDEPYASRVLSDARNVLSEVGVQLAEIGLFAVAKGPGSFTGLRVGLAAVKGWAEVWGRPVAPVSVLAAIAAQGQGRATLLAAAVDARGGQVYGGLFRRDRSGQGLISLGEEVVLPQAEFVPWIFQQCGAEVPAFVTTSADTVRAALAPSPYALAELQEVSAELAPVIGRLGWEQSRRGLVVDGLHLEANYVRRSDAETKWRGG